MGFSLGGAAAAVCAVAAACLGGGGEASASPAETLGADTAVTAFATISSPAAEHGVEVSAPKAPTPPSI